MRRRLYKWMGILVTMILMGMIGCMSVILMNYISKIMEDRCFDELHEAAAGLAGDISNQLESDQQQLEVIADIIESFGEVDSEETVQILRQYESHGMMSGLEILFPDDTVLLGSGERIDASKVLSFEEESSLGCHISDKETDLVDEEKYILRHYVPIRQNGTIAAMLYGIVDLQTLPFQWTVEEFGGNASVYVIDGDTGDFLLDTWHKSLGNIIELGTREMKEGFSVNQLSDELLAGKSGYIVFVSRTIGDYLYLYYEPLSINEWRIAISVPEDVVYQEANNIRVVFYIFLAIEAVLFVSYFIFILYSSSREVKEKQKRLNIISNINGIERLLFIAHRKSSKMELALRQIAQMMTAECAFFETAWDDRESKLYIWNGEGKEIESVWKESGRAGVFQEYFRGGKKELLIYGDQDAVHSGDAIFKLYREARLRNLASVPICNANGAVIGALGIANTMLREIECKLLDSLAFSFTLFYHNMQSYMIAKKMGEIDALTGLLNRNCFERDISLYQQLQGKSLACVYLDADGLHELNNEKGHEAGDEMLKYISGAIQEVFGKEMSYRIGGDEFLAFAAGESEESVVRKAEMIKKTAEAKGYHVSAGVQWTEEVVSVSRLMKGAEQKMYSDKNRYYMEKGESRKSR